MRLNEVGAGDKFPLVPGVESRLTTELRRIKRRLELLEDFVRPVNRAPGSVVRLTARINGLPFGGNSGGGGRTSGGIGSSPGS